jgi:hypothetical protein
MNHILIKNKINQNLKSIYVNTFIYLLCPNPNYPL